MGELVEGVERWEVGGGRWEVSVEVENRKLIQKGKKLVNYWIREFTNSLIK
jgi:hypothetical protein